MQECRPLQLEDIPWVVDEAQDLPNQSEQYRSIEQDPFYTRAYLSQAITAGYMFGAVNEEKASFILGQVGSAWYSPQIEVSELLLWVPTRFRGARTALGLIRLFTELAMDYDPKVIHVGATLDIVNNDRTLKLYELVGYSRDSHGASMRL